MLTALQDIQDIAVSRTISSSDRMFNPENENHYFYVGRSCLLTICNILSARLSNAGGDLPIRTFLDFGCGHGRITRWIRAAFRHAQIDVTDYDKTGVSWCVEQFNCRALEDGVVARSHYDFIWLGSVFTHLPENIVEPLLSDLLAALRPNGVLAFTSQGRYSVERMRDFNWEKDNRRWMHYNLDRSNFEIVVSGYNRTGYGFVEYPRQKDYGVCIARPTWYADRVLCSNDLIQVFFQEKGCDNHQDVSAFMRSDLLGIGKGPLWQ
jgi:SAM-dependent methyltransferase